MVKNAKNLDPFTLKSYTINQFLDEPGILTNLSKNNPQLREKILNFLLGIKPILVVGGESGMGKSLVVSELRRVFESLKKSHSKVFDANICIISWDRLHQMFFDQISLEAGTTIELPQGETHVMGRKVISHVVGDIVRFTSKYVGPNTRILLELPLIDFRGESFFDESRDISHQTQVLVMHSPEARLETYSEGRIMKTSGQPDAMDQIRAKFMYKIVGSAFQKFSVDESDTVIKNWWNSWLTRHDGLLVEWSPSTNRSVFKKSVEQYRELFIRPDVLLPVPVQKYTKRLYESVFEVTRDKDTLIKVLAGY